MTGDPMLPLPYRVAARRRDSADVATLSLEPLGTPLAPFRPGQFNMVYAFGAGEIPVSVSGDPAEPGRIVHTVREVGAVSAAVARAEPGGVLGLRGPFGTAWPVEEARGRDVVIVAGGLGLAPLRPAILHVLAGSEEYGRIAILYGARHPDDLLFRDDLARWRGRLDVTVEVTVDHAGAAWRGNVGVVPALVARLGWAGADTVAMVCGPEVMMRFAIAALEDAGVASGNIHLSMERNMKCAIGLCGHCQFGSDFICRDGPVMRHDRLGARLLMREL
jgi:NAD(P)H-flavin reductase